MKGKKVWITGAGSGIGKALAIAFDKEGAFLILSGRKVEALESTKSILQHKKECSIIPFDLENHDEIEKTYHFHHDQIKNVDILVNNAGISQRSLTKNTTFAVYKKLIDINYLGTVRLSQLMLNDFEKNGKGHFVVMSSTAGKFGVPYRSGYCAAKFALHGFFEALRAELKDTDIAITMVCPGFIKTDISKNALLGDGSPQNTKDKAQDNGMPVEIMAKKTIDAVKAKKEEFNVGGLKEAHLATALARFFPRLFRKIIANSEVT